MEYILYGIPKGFKDRCNEALLYTKGKSIADLEKVQDLASEKGYHSFRIATFNGEKPDFTNIF